MLSYPLIHGSLTCVRNTKCKLKAHASIKRFRWWSLWYYCVIWSTEIYFQLGRAHPQIRFSIRWKYVSWRFCDLTEISHYHFLCECQTDGHRPHKTVKNAINMKSVSRAKLPFFEGIFKLWTLNQQELLFLQMFISFTNQNQAVFMRETDFAFRRIFDVVWGL